MEENTKKRVNKELTSEETAKLREETITFYTQSNEVLKLQAEYEELTARIAQAKLQRMVAIIQMSQLTNPPKKEEEEEEKPKDRHLKKE